MRKKKLNFTLIIFNIAFLFLSVNQVHSQSIYEYELLTDVLYRDPEIEPITEYMKERCVLDIYYPKNKSGYATVIWFHGGGLKAGNKFIPEWLKDQDIAIIAVNYRFSPRVSCPAYIEDAAAAVAWVFNNIENYLFRN